MFNPVGVLVLRKDRATLSKRLTKNPKYSTNVMEILAYRFDCVEFLLETHLALFSAKHFWGGVWGVGRRVHLGGCFGRTVGLPRWHSGKEFYLSVQSKQDV